MKWMLVTLAAWVATGRAVAAELVVVGEGRPAPRVVVKADAGVWEKRAAADLADYIARMTGTNAQAVAASPEALAEKDAALLVVGGAAIEAEPSLADALSKAAKPKPLLRADAIVLRRTGNRVYLAGNNDEAHYYAVSAMLQRWGCRWYMPGEFGECIPKHAKLTVGDLNFAHGSPFEARRYWIAWNGDTTGMADFQRRNFMNSVHVPNGHALEHYVKDLVPKGKTPFNVPIAEDSTADHVAKKVLPQFKAGKHVMLGMDDGIYQSDSPKDKELIALQYDKYFLTQSYTDAFMTFYNGVAERLRKEAPDSPAKIGFLIYSNITLPPVRVTEAKEPLVGYLAPIDIDPIHGMDDPRPGPRAEYRDMLYKWSKVMSGRLVIYDYDQSMLVWRDLPNPSHMAFRQDVKHYRKANILGVDTESRGAMATVFTNLFLRGQLMWDPDADVDALLADFYAKFYGPAAKPMAAYWGTIFKAWEDTACTEHEYFVIPAIYTRDLVARVEGMLKEAERAVEGTEQIHVDRIRFTRLGFDILDAYTRMIAASNTNCDYPAAVAHGERGLAARERLTEMNGTFTTYKKIGEHGYAWWPGEVKQYKELIPFVDGTRGTLVTKLPLEWDFQRDPKADGMKPDGKWERVRSDVYLQAQGILADGLQSYVGHGWYRAEVELTDEQARGNLHVKFPGLFNECWLNVNGQDIAHRPFKGVWWMNDYRFEWDVPLAGKLKPGKNTILLRINNPHHMGGMFRRPFLYRSVGNG